MIECYEKSCQWHLQMEPYCGEAECLQKFDAAGNIITRPTNCADDGIELDITDYDMEGIK